MQDPHRVGMAETSKSDTKLSAEISKTEKELPIPVVASNSSKRALHIRITWFLLAFTLLHTTFSTHLSFQHARNKSLVVNDERADPPIYPTFRTDAVTWDNTSLSILGQRVFIQAGEFHPWRLPSRDLWRDVLQKMHAGGLNTVSIYTHWDQVNPSPGVFDWTGFRDLSFFLTVAQEVGLWVILRPGPYINAETTGGGFPGWVTTLKGELRSNATDYTEAWTPYIQEVSRIAKSFQVSEGGPIILVQVENELTERAETDAYFEEIERVMVEEGIVVPLTFNGWGMTYDFASGKAEPDLYGFDSYPQSFDCSRPSYWKPVLDTYNAYHRKANPSQPLYIPEFQAGAFDPWGPAAPGYEKCRTLTASDFESVFYKGLWASNVKLVSFYMVYGGTNWGHLAFPGVYTSYDYGSPITESRELTDKYSELKRQSLFIRSVRDFANTFIAGNSTTTSATGDSYVVELRNPETGAGFYVVRQANSTSTANATFDVPVQTQRGEVDFSASHGTAVTLLGRESKVISTDIAIGKANHLFYTTASILYTGSIGSRDVVFLHGRVGDLVTASFASAQPHRASTGPAVFNITPSPQSAAVNLVFSTPTPGLSALALSDSLLVLYADSATAGTFWNPLIPAAPTSPFSNFHSFGTNETILVGGPYLVRNASIAGTTLSLVGDVVATSPTLLTIFAPSAVKTVLWNGYPLSLDFDNWPLMAVGALVGTLPAVDTSAIVLPSLAGEWAFRDSLPEIGGDFDDSSWKVVEAGERNNPYPPLYGDLWLYSCEHGFCEGATLWRGAFEGGKCTTGVNLSLSGGEAFAGSVWLNGQFLGTSFGNSTNNLNIIATTNQTFDFPVGSLVSGKNVLTVLVDNMGQDEGDEEPKHPRGIQGYSLIGGGKFDSWKVQGKLGGNVGFPDKVRGVTNEGGFFAEREGWHLPGFDASSWETRDPTTAGLETAGVGFFLKNVTLDLPSGFDIPISIDIEGLDTGGSNSTAFRTQIYVNGWQFGRFVSNLGPQTSFPIPEGILDYQGDNTMGIILWALGVEGARIDGIKFRTGGIYAGGVGAVASDNPGRAPRRRP